MDYGSLRVEAEAMRLFTRRGYAARAKVDLALHADDHPVTREEIAARQEIPSERAQQGDRRTQIQWTEPEGACRTGACAPICWLEIGPGRASTKIEHTPVSQVLHPLILLFRGTA